MEKKHPHLLKKGIWQFKYATLLAFTLSLTACGGGSTKSGATNKTHVINHPIFLRKDVTASPSYAPTGEITQTMPSFSWKAIANATAYRFGHESTDETANDWRDYSLTLDQAGCQNVGDVCVYTPNDYSFPNEVEKVWWVQAKVNGKWQNWSRPIVFTVVDNIASHNAIPTAIAPSGTINTSTPEFVWTSVDNASRYLLGYEDANTAAGWQQHLLTPSEVNCQSGAECRFTPTNTGLQIGQEVAWWVRAKLDNGWNDWSDGHIFTVAQTQQEQKPFIFTIELDKNLNMSKTLSGATPDSDFVIATKGSGYNYTVDCNSDGTPEANGVTSDYTCHYDSYGQYTITISGVFPQFQMQSTNYSHDRWQNPTTKNITIEQWGTQQWRSMESAFGDFTGGISFADIHNPDLSHVISMKMMFSLAEQFNEDITDWDVSHVTDMSSMFAGTKVFNQPIGNWDVGNVRKMRAMFTRTKAFNQSIENWDLSHVTDMSSMFARAQVFNQPIGNWDVSNVIDMSSMFDEAQVFNQPIGNWDVGNVKKMVAMFARTKAFNQPIGSWNVSNVTTMHHMFFGAKTFDQPIGNWDVGNVTVMDRMFYLAGAFNQPIGNWDVSNVTSMTGMFIQAEVFNQDIGNWDVSNVTRMGGILTKASAFDSNNYDRLLIGWSNLNLQQGVLFEAENTSYSAAAVDARNKLINTFNWVIRDGGLLRPQP